MAADCAHGPTCDTCRNYESKDTPMDVSPDSTVSFTVKELLAEQTSLLRQIDKKVDGKADKTDLIPILQRLDAHDKRITSLEDGREEDKTVANVKSSFRRRVWMAVTAIAVPVSTTLLIVNHHP